jgi:hypothetical protein
MFDSSKAYFAHVAGIYASLLDIVERMERYRDLALRITGSLDGVRVQRDPEYSRVENAVIMLDGLSDEADAKVRAYKQEAAEAEEIIDTLENPSHRRILRLRYISGHRFDVIKEIMRYEHLSWVFRLHGYALALTAPELRRRHLIK